MVLMKMDFFHAKTLISQRAHHKEMFVVKV